MKMPVKYLSVIFVLSLVSGLIIYACSNDDSKAVVNDFKDSFMDFIEGRDENALLKFVPEEFSDFEISMDSGKTRYVPESLDDLEAIFEEIAYEFEGDSVTVLQSNETSSNESIVLTYTIKVVDGCMERTVPVKVELTRNEAGDGWVMTAMDVHN